MIIKASRVFSGDDSALLIGYVVNGNGSINVIVFFGEADDKKVDKLFSTIEKVTTNDIKSFRVNAETNIRFYSMKILEKSNFELFKKVNSGITNRTDYGIYKFRSLEEKLDSLMK